MYTNLSYIDLFLFAVYSTFMEPSILHLILSYMLSKCLLLLYRIIQRFTDHTSAVGAALTYSYSVSHTDTFFLRKALL